MRACERRQEGTLLTQDGERGRGRGVRVRSSYAEETEADSFGESNCYGLHSPRCVRVWAVSV